MVPVLAAAIAASACSASPAPPPETASGAPPAGSAAPASATPEAAALVTAPEGARSNTFTGTVAEAMDAGEYTYARLEGGGRDVWIAASRFEARPGRTVTASLDMPMEDFESKTLGRTFPLLYFVSRIALDGATLDSTAQAGQAAPPALMTSHGTPGDGGRGPVQVATLQPPPGGMSIADVIAKRSALSGKPVTIQGTVVKFNGGIMDRNWLHLQDGSGSEATGTHDLTVTTTDTVQVGDVVTVSGVVGTDKDFGAGYAYGVIVEQARISRK
jgi:hypothetical protein